MELVVYINGKEIASVEVDAYKKSSKHTIQEKVSNLPEIKALLKNLPIKDSVYKSPWEEEDGWINLLIDNYQDYSHFIRQRTNKKGSSGIILPSNS